MGSKAWICMPAIYTSNSTQARHTSYRRPLERSREMGLPGDFWDYEKQFFKKRSLSQMVP